MFYSVRYGCSLISLELRTVNLHETSFGLIFSFLRMEQSMYVFESICLESPKAQRIEFGMNAALLYLS